LHKRVEESKEGGEGGKKVKVSLHPSIHLHTTHTLSERERNKITNVHKKEREETERQKYQKSAA
jgi:hypothetical protein